MLSEWEDRLGLQRMPPWLIAFEEEPDAAVHSLLTGEFYFGMANLDDPTRLLMDWIQLLGDSGDFVTRLDSALQKWAVLNWGTTSDEPTDARRLATAWTRLADVVALSEQMPVTSRFLRSVFAEAPSYLRPLSHGRSLDTLGRYFLAVARDQADDELRPFWWQLSHLQPDGTPYYHGVYGLEGLQGLPNDGTFPVEVAYGLLRFARALDRLERRGALGLTRAAQEFRWVARRTVRAYPFGLVWERILGQAIREDPNRSDAWLIEVVPGIERHLKHRQPDRDPSPVKQEPFWRPRVAEVEKTFKTSPDRAILLATRLLNDQLAFVKSTGNTRYYVESLCNFAERALDGHPLIALRWARAAHMWDVSNPYAWTTLSRALYASSRPDDALRIAWETTERFPQDQIGWNILTALLRSAGRLQDAQIVSNEAVKRFPTDVPVWTQRGDLLMAIKEWQAAEQAYQRALAEAESVTSDRDYASLLWARLGRLWRKQGRNEAAEQAYRRAISLPPAIANAWLGLAAVLRREGREKEARRILQSGLELFPRDERILSALAKLESAADAEEPQDLEQRPQALAQAGHGIHPRDIVNLTADLDAVELAALPETAPEEGGGEAADSVSPRLSTAEALLMEGWSEEAAVYFQEVLAENPGLEEAQRGLDRALLLGGSTEVGSEADRDTGVPAPDADSRAAKVIEARMLRRGAARPGLSQGDADDLGGRALAALDEVLAACPYDARALAEKAYLLVDMGRLDEASRLASDAASGRSTQSLMAALARERRATAERMGEHFSDERLSHLLEPYGRVRSSNPAFEPAARLGDLRACLALQDGDIHRERVLQAVSRLAKRLDALEREDGEHLARYGTPPFDSWWSRQVKQAILENGGDHGLEPEVVSRRAQERRLDLDIMEEDFNNRLSFI